MALTPEQWQQVRDLFEVLCERRLGEREALLAEADADEAVRSQVRRMLDADAGDRLAERVSDQAPELTEAALDRDRSGQTVGAFRLLERVGRGGMGEVYRAERVDGLYRQQVAVKFLAVSGDRQIRGFERERQILAGLEHPGIARLIDGGEDEEGTPYLVMEYVEGQPIDNWWSRQAAEPAHLIRRIIDACDAVAHANERLVLHLDLKPANILIDDGGRLRLLDFGVAALLSDPQDPAQRGYTPGYAAPELRSGETLSTAADSFGLGIILYSLLSGRHPYLRHGENAETLRRGIPDREPIPLARATRDAGAFGLEPSTPPHIDRDLDAILSRAVAPTPARRYSDAARLGEDLRCYLAGRPVSARPPRPGYLLRRWLGRHRLAAGAGLLAVLSLLAGAGLAGWQAREATRQRDIARSEAQKSKEISGFLSDIFTVPNPSESRGRSVTASELLERGVERIDEELASDPALRIELKQVMAGTYRSLGLYDEAEALLRDAMREAAVSLPDTAGPRGRLLMELGWLHAYQGRFEDSTRVLREAVAELEASAPGSEALALACQRLATPLINQSAYGQAEQAALRARELFRERSPLPLERIAAVTGLLATIATVSNQPQLAAELFSESLALNRKLHGADHVSVALDHNNLATLHYRQRDYEQAVEHYRRAIAIYRRFFGMDNDQVAVPLGSLGQALRQLGRFSEARAALGEALAIQQQWSGPDHVSSALTRVLLAELDWHLGGGGPDEGVERAAERLVEVYSESQSYHCLGLNALAWLSLEENAAEAATLADRALACSRSSVGERSYQALRARLTGAWAFLALGRGDEVRLALQKLETDLAFNEQRDPLTTRGVQRLRERLEAKSGL